MSIKAASAYFEEDAVGNPTILTPTPVSPLDAASITNQTPTLVASAYRTTLNSDHAFTEFRVSTTAAMSVVVATTGIVAAVESWVVSPSLATGLDFWWDVRYQNTDGDWSGRSTPTTFTIPDSAIQTPTNALPADLDTAQTDNVTLTADAFLSVPTTGHAATQWQISLVNDFSVVAFDSGEDAVNLLSYTQAGVVLNQTTYYWRVRYKSDSLGWSGFSTYFTFTTVDEAVQKPTNATPTNGATEIGKTVTVSGDSYTAIPSGNEAHNATQIQVGNSDFSVLYYDAVLGAVESASVTGYPEGDITVFWRIRYSGATTGYSEWSTPTSFVTATLFVDWLNHDGTQDGAFLSLDALVTQNTTRESASSCSLGGDNMLVLFASAVASSYGLGAYVVGCSGVVASKLATVTLLSGSIYTRSGCLQLETNKALVWGAYTGVLHVRVVTFNGSTLSQGPQLTIANSDIASNEGPEIVDLGDPTKVMRIIINGSVVGAQIINISGTTLTTGISGAATASSLYFDRNSTKLVAPGKVLQVGYKATTDHPTVARIITINDGVDITFGTLYENATTLASTNTQTLALGYDVGEPNAFTAFQAGGTVSELIAWKATFVGDVITWSGNDLYSDGNYVHNIQTLNPVAGQQYVMVVDNSNDIIGIPYDQSTNDFKELSDVVHDPSTTNWETMAIGLIDPTRILLFESGGSSGTLRAKILNGLPS